MSTQITLANFTTRMIFEFVLNNEELHAHNEDKLSLIDDDSLIVAILCIPKSYRSLFDTISKDGTLIIKRDALDPATLRGFIKMISAKHILVKGVDKFISYSITDKIEEVDSHYKIWFNNHEFFNRMMTTYNKFIQVYPEASEMEFTSQYPASLYRYLLTVDYPKNVTFDIVSIKDMLNLHKDSSYVSFKIIEIKLIPKIKEDLARYGIVVKEKRIPADYAKSMIFKMDYTTYKKAYLNK